MCVSFDIRFRHKTLTLGLATWSIQTHFIYRESRVIPDMSLLEYQNVSTQTFDTLESWLCINQRVRNGNFHHRRHDKLIHSQ